MRQYSKDKLMNEMVQEQEKIKDEVNRYAIYSQLGNIKSKKWEMIQYNNKKLFGRSCFCVGEEYMVEDPSRNMMTD